MAQTGGAGGYNNPLKKFKYYIQLLAEVDYGY